MSRKPFLCKKIAEEQLQDICPLAVRGLLHWAEWRAAPNVTENDNFHLMASFAVFFNNCGEAIYV